MKTGKVSRTALKVGTNLVSLSHKAGWAERLPEGFGELTERLIAHANVFGYGPTAMGWSKKPWVIRIHDRAEQRFPGSYEGLGYRKVFMNEQVLDAIKQGATRVVIIGAGFDTVCLRLAPRFPDVGFIEIDHPATSSAKAKGVRAEGQPENLSLVAADLSENKLSDLLRTQPNWDSAARTVLVAEGLLMYLTHQQISELFAQAAACTGPGTRLAFSHLLGLDHFSAWVRFSLRLIGEPWLSSVPREEVEDYVAKLGWRLIAQDKLRDRRMLEACAVAEVV